MIPEAESLSGTSLARPLVFISYTHEPEENAEFTRDLASRLQMAGLQPWLDEEQIPAATDFEKAVREVAKEAEKALFVVTGTWLERSYTNYEMRLFGKNPDARLVVLLREEVDDTRIGPEVTDLHMIKWLADDPEPDARFWEIYCGLMDVRPGPRELWGERGRGLVDGVTPETTNEDADRAALAKSQKDESLADGVIMRLPCSGRPTAVFTGKRWSFLVTDCGEWIGVNAEGRFHQPPEWLSAYSAAVVGNDDELLVGLYEPIVVKLRGARWQYLRQQAPVLALAKTPRGSVAGTAAGAIVPVASDRPSSAARIRDPVVDLAAFDDGLMVVGSRGIFGYLRWPISAQQELVWSDDSPELGRPVGLFPAMETRRVGVYSSTRLGILDPITNQLALCDREFPDGIRAVTFLGAGAHTYGVVSDGGALTLLDSGAQEADRIRLPDEAGPVLGCCAIHTPASALVWTAAGTLYEVGSDGGVVQFAAEHVVLAFPGSEGDSRIHAVRWSPGEPPTLQCLAGGGGA